MGQMADSMQLVDLHPVLPSAAEASNTLFVHQIRKQSPVRLEQNFARHCTTLCLATRFAYVTYAHNVDAITTSTLNILLTVLVCGVCVCVCVRVFCTVSICAAHASAALVTCSMPLFDLNSRSKKTNKNRKTAVSFNKKTINKPNYYRNDSFILYWTENYWLILRHCFSCYFNSRFIGRAYN